MVKDHFVTGDYEDSTDEEEDEEYEEITNVQEDQVIEKLQNVIPKGKYIKVTISNIKFELYNKLRNRNIVLSQIDYGENTRGFLMVKFKR